MALVVDLIIPALNEEKAIQEVLKEIPSELVREIVVIDNNSSDRTSEMARALGATTLLCNDPGYGNACLLGIEYLKSKEQLPDVLVFLDGDHSDFPEELPLLLNEIEASNDMVIGSRALGERESGSMTIPQVLGNWLATRMLFWIYGVRFTDLGPFRAIRWDALMKLKMEDRNYGWTVEMQVKAAKQKMRCSEVAVSYRKRIGISKVSGTIKGAFLAGYKIIFTILKFSLK